MPKYIDIKASFQDLLLVRLGTYHFICNPLTGQRVALPNSPIGSYEIWGFFGEHKNSQFSYNVLLILNIGGTENEYVLNASIFCSETGKWSPSISSCPRTLAPEFLFWDKCLIASNGILYSMLYDREEGVEEEVIRGFAVFDLSKSTRNTSDDLIRFWFVHLPVDFARGLLAFLKHVCYGLVKGRLRLSQFLKIEGNFVLKVWELNHNNDNNNNDLEWLLVHDLCLEWLLVDDFSLIRNKTNRIFVAGFHPNNGDVIFVFLDRDLYKYKIGQGKYEKVGQLPYPIYQKRIALDLPRHLCKFTLVHPSWPTLIPFKRFVKTFDGDVYFDVIAMGTSGFCGADLSRLLDVVTILSGRHGRTNIPSW